MTVEEIEIIVTAKVEEALREFIKIVPAIKEQMKKAQEAFSRIDTKTMTNKLHQAVQFIKKKMQDFKRSTENNEIAIKINNKDAQKQINQVQKQIDSLQEKINARQLKLNVITPQLDKITEKTTKEVTPDGLSSSNPAIQQTINNSLSKNKDYSKLLAQEDKITQELQEYNKQLGNAKAKMAQLNQETSKTGTSQNKLTSFFGTFREKLSKSKIDVSQLREVFSKIPNIVTKITNHIKGMGKGLKSGLGHILKYAGALFSIRGIYSVLSNSASSWLSSQNEGAQQLSKNIEYMKYSMGSAFAPIIEYVINLIYQLMKAIQSVVYAFSGINIFAKATAASMKSTEKSAKQTSKSLSGIHGEINNVSENKDSGNSSGVNPSIDLSQIDNQMNTFSQKLYDFFKPLVDSWNIYGAGLIEQIKTTAGQVGGLITSVWKSFENIIANGTAYSLLQNILAIIGNIAEAFKNAWNYNNNGDTIIQNLANTFNNLLIAINNVVKSEEFQEWLKNCSDKFKEITEKLGSIDWQPLVNALMQIGTTVGTIAIEILSGLVEIFKWLAENPIVAEIILAIAVAITVVSTVLGVLSTVMGILTPIATGLGVSMTSLILPILGIVAAIAAVIAIVILVIANWEWLCEQAQIIWNIVAEFFKNLWQGICDTITNVWNGIKDFFIGLWDGIKNVVMTVWNGIKDFFINYFNTVKGIFESIWNGISTFVSNIFNGIKDTISNVLNTIKTIWTNIWNGLSTVVSNVFNRNMELYKRYNKFHFRTE